MSKLGPVAAAALFIMVAVSGTFAASSIEELVISAVSEDEAAAKAAIATLRAMGPEGLDAIRLRYGMEIAQYERTGEKTTAWHRIAAALDAVAMQKDAYSSGLFWYTDLDDAVKAAKAADRPILSLRLLGNLNEEFSCANSRLFRALLYSDPAIAGYLRNNYILHWRSVRPAPRITIDFGDGRKIERTVTGNSIHYILDEDGRIIDALPGLYSPKAFRIYLGQGRDINRTIEGKSNAVKELALKRYRKISFDRIFERRNAALSAANVTLREENGSTASLPAGFRTFAKIAVVSEEPILRVYDDFARFEPRLDLTDWSKLADRYSPKVELSSESVAFVRRQTGEAGRTPAQHEALIARIVRFTGLDTTRNDFLYHLKIYEWLNDDGMKVKEIEAFNERVYDQIFRTPSYDKWLGLYSSDVYTALDGNGLVY